MIQIVIKKSGRWPDTPIFSTGKLTAHNREGNYLLNKIILVVIKKIA
jgi:hypothetical protein